MNISVCMATYNGSSFIYKQIVSILDQLAIDDELIIVDDCSLDTTLDIVSSIIDNRIVVFKNDVNVGVNQSFSRAILAAKGDYIFLSDQDDIWIEGRVRLMIDYLNKNNVYLLTSNFSWINEFDIPVVVHFDGVSSLRSRNYFGNIWDIFVGKTNYFGCAMLFRREMKAYIVPIPNFVESHDLWIAKIGNLLGSQVHLDNITFLKRIHRSNMTSTSSNRRLFAKIYSRYIFLKSLIYILLRRLIFINS